MTIPLLCVFAEVPDHRRETENKLHLLGDILVIATCAVLSGAEGWESIAEYGRTKEAFFRRFLSLPHSIPSADTFGRVFAKLDPKAFTQAFGRWMASVCEATGLTPIAIDGKSVRRSPKATSTGCLHLVSAWATESRLTLGQVSVPDGSNEIAVIPELLSLLELKGALVTLDAAGCQTEIAEQIRQQGGDYLLTVKGNQPSLQQAVQTAFERAGETGFSQCSMSAAIEEGHGRHEERYVTVIAKPEGLPSVWKDVGAVVMVGREREVNGKNTSAVHYYITSLRCSAKRLAEYIRGHWGIENSLHWVLDVVFREDDSRTRAGHAGANLAMIRKVAVSLLRRAPGKGSSVTKRLKAGWDDDYLLQVVQQIPAHIVR